MPVNEHELKELRKVAFEVFSSNIDAMINETPAMDFDEVCDAGSSFASETGLTMDEVNEYIHQYRAKKHARTD